MDKLDIEIKNKNYKRNNKLIIVFLLIIQTDISSSMESLIDRRPGVSVNGVLFPDIIRFFFLAWVEYPKSLKDIFFIVACSCKTGQRSVHSPVYKVCDSKELKGKMFIFFDYSFSIKGFFFSWLAHRSSHFNIKFNFRCIWFFEFYDRS